MRPDIASVEGLDLPRLDPFIVRRGLSHPGRTLICGARPAGRSGFFIVSVYGWFQFRKHDAEVGLRPGWAGKKGRLQLAGASALMYIVYGAFCLLGFVSWWRIERHDRSSSPPDPAGGQDTSEVMTQPIG